MNWDMRSGHDLFQGIFKYGCEVLQYAIKRSEQMPLELQ